MAGYDADIKKEMDVITTVLNRLFDEDDIDYYIGDYHKKYPHSTINQHQQAIEVDNIPNGTHITHLPIKMQRLVEIDNTLNDILKDMNKRPAHIRRRNMYVPAINNHPNQSVYLSNNIKTHKKRNTQTSYIKLYTLKKIRKQNALRTNNTGNNPKSNKNIYS